MMILVKHSLSSITMHIALTIPIPRLICAQIGKLLRNFLWSSYHSQTKKNMIRWEIICLLKKEGGPGINWASELNEACMLRLGWQAMTTLTLRANWFNLRYFRIFFLQHPSNTLVGSCIWKKITSLAKILLGCAWTVGDDTKISLWHDRWMEHSFIASFFPQF